jgi:hypothetical protein
MRFWISADDARNEHESPRRILLGGLSLRARDEESGFDATAAFNFNVKLLNATGRMQIVAERLRTR